MEVLKRYDRVEDVRDVENYKVSENQNIRIIDEMMPCYSMI